MYPVVRLLCCLIIYTKGAIYMKRLMVSLFALVTAVLLTACSVPSAGGGSSGSRENHLGEPFEASMTLTLDRLEAQGKLSGNEDSWQAEFESPNTLSGVVLTFSNTDGTVTASYKGLTFSVPKSALPVKAMLLNLIAAVGENSRNEMLSGEEKDGILTVSGTLDSGGYLLSVDSSGLLSRFEMPDSKLTIVFTDTRLTGSSPALPSSEPVTVPATFSPPPAAA